MNPPRRCRLARFLRGVAAGGGAGRDRRLERGAMTNYEVVRGRPQGALEILMKHIESANTTTTRGLLQYQQDKADICPDTK